MKSYEREGLIERVEREGATVGARIPETITVQGEEMALRRFVFETRQADGVRSENREAVETAKRNLRRERLARKQRLENEDNDLTVEEGERLVASIIGLDRALHALDDLGSTDLEREAKAQETADQKRWMSFLKEALGQESGRRNRP
jgi:hypothetical protein